MIIELLDGENEILVSGLDAMTAMATDGIYISLEKFAADNDVPLSTLRVWKKRFKVEAIRIFGRDYVKKNTEIKTRRYKKNVQKCKSGEALRLN